MYNHSSLLRFHNFHKLTTRVLRRIFSSPFITLLTIITIVLLSRIIFDIFFYFHRHLTSLLSVNDHFGNQSSSYYMYHQFIINACHIKQLLLYYIIVGHIVLLRSVRVIYIGFSNLVRLSSQ